MEDSDSDWMDRVRFGVVPTQGGNEIPEPEQWHLAQAELVVDEDGEMAVDEDELPIFAWGAQIESPNLAVEWSGWKRYTPDRIWFN